VLLLLLPIAWLAVVIVVVAACQAAARGDRALRHAGIERPRVLGEDRCAWDVSAARALTARSRSPLRRRLQRRRASRLAAAARLRRISHGIR
jgi:hypothetical protein